MACFWQDMVAATQVCDLGVEPPGDPEFNSYNVGSGGGFFLFRSSWFGAGTNLIDAALTAAANVNLTGYLSGETLVPVNPPVVGYYQATGYGTDPGGGSDTECFLFTDSDLNSAGIPFNTPVDVLVDFNPPGGTVATGTVTAEFGS